MSHYVVYLTAEQPFSRDTLIGAALFSASPARMQDGTVAAKGTPSLVAYGSTREAALLSLRASLQAAVGAVEVEIMNRRAAEKTGVPYVDFSVDGGDEFEVGDEEDEDDDGAD